MEIKIEMSHFGDSQKRKRRQKRDAETRKPGDLEQTVCRVSAAATYAPAVNNATVEVKELQNGEQNP
jgi:hypothetical protein